MSNLFLFTGVIGWIFQMRAAISWVGGVLPQRLRHIIRRQVVRLL
ncbi:MAG: hypothetical protein V1784_01880 [bacterium]